MAKKASRRTNGRSNGRARETPEPVQGDETVPEEMHQLFAHIQHGTKRAFLTAYAMLGTKKKAMEACGTYDTAVWYWMKQEGPEADEFRVALKVAKRIADERLVQEVYRRAVEGELEPQTHNGQLIFYDVDEQGQPVPPGDDRAVKQTLLTKRKRSDALLIFATKAAFPEQYRERLDVQADIQADVRVRFYLPPNSRESDEVIDVGPEDIRRLQEPEQNGDGEHDSTEG